LKSFLDQTAVPELKAMALSADDPHDRMAPVIALTRYATAQQMALSSGTIQDTEQLQLRPSAPNPSLLALQEIAQQSTDPKVKQSAGNIVAGLQRRAQQ
jgi:hypothetical protein